MKQVIILTITALFMGCGGGTETPNTGTDWGPVDSVDLVLTVQESITMTDFDNAAKTDADLAGVATGLDLYAAGKVEDSRGATVTWAEGTNKTGGVAAAVKLCDAAGCEVALQSRVGKEITWLSASGASTSMRTVGQPVLLKNLQGHNLDNRTRLFALSTGPLGLNLDEENLPPIDFSKRRFVALNTFGDLFTTNLAEVTGVIEKAGHYDTVEERQYVREEDVAETFDSLDYMDAVVWLSQGVREERKAGGKEYVTVGLTANRAVYGETLFSRQDIADIWSRNVAGGPGILFLAASNSYSDGSSNQPEPNASLWRKLDDTHRLLIGVEGHADVNHTIRAAAVFFERYLSGEATLGEALDAGSAWLEETGAKLRTNETDLSRKVEKTYAQVESSLPIAASDLQLTVPITGTPQCGEGDGPKSPKDEDFATAWAKVSLTGAFLEGERKMDTQTLKVDTHLRALFTGFEVGDRVLIEAWGDMDKVQFRDFYAFGEGIIESVETDDASGKVTIKFGGTAHTAPFRDENGLNCVLVSPTIATTTGSLGTLVLTP